jgi:SAM-dependent methyltransferase
VSERFFRALATEAAALYPARDRLARRFAAGKLNGDPAFAHLLRAGLIPHHARVLDLGSGQGLLAALLVAARARHGRGEWPAGWPAPPDPRRFTGIDLRARDVERANHACGGNGATRFVQGDIRTTGFGQADAIVILDVLHYIDYAAQADVLRRVREALAGGGVLLLRVADAAPTLRFRITLAVDRLVMALRGHRLERLHCKPLARWIAELEALGFRVAATPMSAGTPFANVLLVARYDSPR